MSRRFTRPVMAIGLTAAALATVLISGPAQAAPVTAQPRATAVSAPQTVNTAVVTSTPKQRAKAVAQLHQQRAAARSASLRARAVSVALAQVGDNYASGAEGPNAFDCSGLTKYAWSKAGVNLEHYSYAQYSETRRVPAKQALPGDLVFYLSNGAHHVGMYIGRGRIVHASDYGVGVIVSPMLGTAWTNAHFTGVGRVA